MRAILAATLTSLASPILASDFSLALPIDCTLGETCYIQQYVDHDPGPGARDFKCSGLSYDEHKGTDFALPTLADLEDDIDVLAAAPGRVRGMRDGMQDRLFLPEHTDTIDGRDCGNGVVLVHDGGWETQYCHLRQGSVRVRSGQTVATGEVLGHVGLSGRTQFPHLHLSVRRNGEVVDPFDSEAAHACEGEADDSLWQVTPAYTPGALLDIGISTDIPGYDAVRAGTAAETDITSDAAALVIYGFAFGGQTGDVMILRLTGPDTIIADDRIELERNQAQFFRAAGKRLTATGWPSGRYDGEVQLGRAGRVIDTRRVSFEIP